MKIISFSRTTEALCAGRKTVTRREWKDSHAARFKPGDLVAAWSDSPRRRGKPVGVVRIVSVTKEPMSQMPDSDWEAEGFGYMEERHLEIEKGIRGQDLWTQWRNNGDLTMWVIRFEVVEVYDKGPLEI